MSSISSPVVGIIVFSVGIILMLAIAGVVVGAIALNKANHVSGIVGPPGPAGPTGPQGTLSVYRTQLMAPTPLVNIGVAYDPSSEPSVIYHTISSLGIEPSLNTAQITFNGTLAIDYPAPVGGSVASNILVTLSSDESATPGYSSHTVVELSANSSQVQMYDFSITDVVTALQGRVYIRVSLFQATNPVGIAFGNVNLRRGGTWIVNPVEILTY